MLETMITGSLPKPAWLADPGARLYAPWTVAPQHLREAQDDAVRLAIADQEEAGLDIVTDGEQRRRHYIWGFVEGLAGIDMQNLGEKVTRGGRYSSRPIRVPRIVGEIGRTRPVLVEALRFAKTATTRPVKVTLPGPMTIVDTLLDAHTGLDEAALAMRFAEILNAEARDLAGAGADIVQFDEPCFNIHLEKVAAWGITALERAMEGVAATRSVHICYGYGVPVALAWKKSNRSWGHYGVTLPLLEASGVDMVSVECAASGVDVSVLAALRSKSVALGVIDVGTDAVESPEDVARRIADALRYVEPDRLYPTTDCGMVPRPREVARKKMESLARGAHAAASNL